jgi:DNA replication and repair protein RecF
VGKTNLLEAMHLATQGFSPRTRADTQLIRFGESAAAVSVGLSHGRVEHNIEVRIATGSGKSAELDGARLSSAEVLRREFPTLVFTPDRLSVIKGGPAVRRAYFDRALARLHPARGSLSGEYAATLIQRNAALRRVQLGVSPRSALEPWTARLVELGTALAAGRQATISALAPGFHDRLEELGVPGGALSYPADPPTLEALERRIETDIATGMTGSGPHRDEILVEAGSHDLRSFGSQGQQRLGLLALLLAEAALVPSSPLLLLDDVLSELDARRRAVLAHHVALLEQTLITATHRSALPAEPTQVVEVRPGQAH